MNYLELQTRINKIVEQVNSYEASLPDEVRDEQELIALHKYVDLYSLRAVYDWIFSKELYKKTNETLANSSNAVMISFNNYYIPTGVNYNYFQSAAQIATTFISNAFSYVSLKDFTYISNIGSNIIASHNYTWYTPNYSYASTCSQAVLFPIQNSEGVSNPRNSGLTNYTYAIPQDSILTESQISNLTNKMTGMFRASSGKRLHLAQLEGILYITGASYYPPNESEVVYLPILSYNGYSYPSAEQIIYSNGKNANSGNKAYTKYGTNYHSYRLKYYVPMNTRFGSTFTPEKLQINKFYKSTHNYHIPENKLPLVLYFEMCFKRRRPGCKALGLDFVPAKSDVVDNDPQGLATRLALAQTKPYYVGRCFFPELEQYYTEDGYYQRKLADKICEETQNMTDEEFIRNYKLNYETYAYATGDEL